MMSLFFPLFLFFLFRFFLLFLFVFFSSSSSTQWMSLPSGWRLLYQTDEFARGDSRKRGRVRTPNYLKGVQWSPDGTCLLTSSLDKTVRLFTLFASIRHRDFTHAYHSAMHTCYRPYAAYDSDAPGIEQCTLHSSLQVFEAEIVYDFRWFPLMNSMCLP